MFDNIVEKKKAILVAVCTRKDDIEDIKLSLEELEQLADTANINVVDKFIQNRHKIHSAFYAGTGFIADIKEQMEEDEIDFLIFNNELTPSQTFNIQKEYEIDALDRTELILSIFHHHAKTTEARLQVELAELKYQLPRLKKKWSHLDRIGGTAASSGGRAGTRGKGERQLEIDRRKIHERIKVINDKLSKINVQHESERKKRLREFHKVCLVGYTNAGKSTLFNTLTDANVQADDQLFLTLDSTARALDTGKGRDIIISDTVGFIADLPHTLVASFRATLKDAVDADLLLHVIDLSSKDYKKQAVEVDKVLKEIGADHIPRINVLNKIDKLESSVLQNRLEFWQSEDSVEISAKSKLNIESLVKTIDDSLNDSKIVTFLIPYSDSEMEAQLHVIGKVFDVKYEQDGALVTAELNMKDMYRFEQWQVENV